MRNRKNNNIKNIKDYIVPIVTFLLIFILIYIAFSGWDEKESTDNINTINVQNTNNNWIDILFWGSDTEVELINKKNKKSVLNNSDKINIWESIIVKSWDVSFSIPTKWDFKLNTNGKITYLSNEEINLESNALWIDSKDSIKVSTKFSDINIWKNSTVNIEQNEVSTTVYLLNGKTEIKNLWWVSTFLSTGKKIIISNKDALKKDLDMNLLKQDFDDYFKISDWYLKNSNWTVNTEINNEDNNSWTWELTGTGEIKKEKKNNNILGLLNFDNIYDEGSVDSEYTNLSWKFADERISKIIINWKPAVINVENKTFNLIWVNTSKKENDIAIKVYDAEENLLWKYLYTLYYSSWKKDSNLTNNFAKVNTKPYPVNWEDFIISIPTVKNWETTSSKNTFYGTVKNPDVKYVTVNGYRLKTFNWKTFRYHAFEEYKTLWEWVNIYEIKYYNSNGKVILKKYITINKISKKVKKVKKISKEAGIN